MSEPFLLPDEPVLPPRPAQVPALPDGVPDIFAEGIYGLPIGDGLARFSLVASRTAPDGRGLQMALAARVVMPLAGLLRIHEALAGIVRELERQGVVGRREQAGSGCWLRSRPPVTNADLDGGVDCIPMASRCRPAGVGSQGDLALSKAFRRNPRGAGPCAGRRPR